jgi:T-complex protein 1 subunit delta
VHAQDVAAGDGTTSVTVICGALLRKCLELLERGVHPTVISDAFAKAAEKAVEILASIAIPVDLGDRAALVRAANTCAFAFVSPPALACAGSCLLLAHDVAV